MEGISVYQKLIDVNWVYWECHPARSYTSMDCLYMCPLWLKSINGYLVVWVGGSKYCSRAIILIILVTGASWDSKPPKSPVNHWILGWRKTRKAWSVILQTTDRLVAWSNEFMPSQVNSKSWGTLKHYNFSQDNKSPSKCFRIFSLPISLAPLAFGKHFRHQIFYDSYDSCTTIWFFLGTNQMVFQSVPHFLLGNVGKSWNPQAAATALGCSS